MTTLVAPAQGAELRYVVADPGEAMVINLTGSLNRGIDLVSSYAEVIQVSTVGAGWVGDFVMSGSAPKVSAAADAPDPLEAAFAEFADESLALAQETFEAVSQTWPRD